MVTGAQPTANRNAATATESRREGGHERRNGDMTPFAYGVPHVPRKGGGLEVHPETTLKAVLESGSPDVVAAP